MANTSAVQQSRVIRVISAPLLPLVGALWKGYARRSLAVLSTELTR